MIQAILFALLLLIFVIVGVEKFTELERKEKLFIYAFLGLLFAGVGIYQAQTEAQEKQNREVVLAFEQGKDITCGGTTISKKDFNFVSGTFSFVAKEKSEFKGKLFRAEECVVK